MKRGKKLALIALTGILVLGGILGGTAVTFADDETIPADNPLVNRIAEIYEANTGTPLDIDQLQQAFTEARGDLRLEARDSHLDQLVEDGVITQEEADEMKAWMDARPDTSFGRANMGADSQFGKMFRGQRGLGGGFSGSRGFGGFSGNCPIDA